jgi:cytochrome b subunit of formate dehydrogenase
MPATQYNFSSNELILLFLIVLLLFVCITGFILSFDDKED